MLVVLRRFAGPRWAPERIELPGALQGRPRIEEEFGCDVTAGERAAVVFRTELLELPNPSRKLSNDESVTRVPDSDEFAAVLEHLIRLAMLSGRASIDQIASRLGLPRRTMQRRLNERGTTFERIAQNLSLERACNLLHTSSSSITAIALELGYTETAHFTRAFRRWTGETPRQWRSRERRGSEIPFGASPNYGFSRGKVR